MKLTHPAVLVAAAFTAVGAFAIAQQPASKPAKPMAPAQAEKPAIPGMSEAEMKACMEAATPGPNHELLAKSAGTWSGKCTMTMPGAEPMHSECTTVVTPIMGGKFVRWEMSGDMPGMGPMEGTGTYGYDNVGKQFQATWVTSCGTGMMHGTGALSDDGKTLTWTYKYNCPIAKGPVTMRDVETHPNPDTITVSTFGPDPATGKEFKMMEMTLTRQAKAPAKAAR